MLIARLLPGSTAFISISDGRQWLMFPETTCLGSQLGLVLLYHWQLREHSIGKLDQMYQPTGLSGIVHSRTLYIGVMVRSMFLDTFHS